ncbi:MAG TPA: phenylalanine--tRNA ligase beta subunit-related protein [Thermoanaerobaculia bacterium]|nr:phenylalanine--tRNA ligase beta subunit-related protein [Thermoanaerobaculia bacterium]
MLTISVDRKVFERFPDFRRGLVVATGVTNHGADPELEALLASASEEAAAHPVDLAADPRITVWTEAHRRFGSNPNRFPPSHLALRKRVQKPGTRLPFVNKAVAIMSYASITGVIPVGADDVAKAGRTLELREATGEEVFFPLGQPEAPEQPVPGEVVYLAADTGVVMCRRWNWRNGHLSALGDETRDLVFNVDGLGEGADERVAVIRDLVASLLERHCGARVLLGLLHPDSPVFQVSS